MSVIRELITQLEYEDDLQRKKDEEHFAEQDKKYEELYKKLNFFNDENKKFMDSITKRLTQLTANKHTIEKALEQTDNLTGLPIPQEQHGAVVDLITKITGFINNTDVINKPNSFSPDNLHENIISAIESIENDLKDSHAEMTQAQSLYYNTECLKNLTIGSSGKEDSRI